MIGLLISLLLLPFKLIWILVGLVFALCGKLLTAGIGLILVLVGVILCITIIALPLGILFIIFGALLCVKGILF